MNLQTDGTPRCSYCDWSTKRPLSSGSTFQDGKEPVPTFLVLSQRRPRKQEPCYRHCHLKHSITASKLTKASLPGTLRYNKWKRSFSFLKSITDKYAWFNGDVTELIVPVITLYLLRHLSVYVKRQIHQIRNISVTKTLLTL